VPDEFMKVNRSDFAYVLAFPVWYKMEPCNTLSGLGVRNLPAFYPEIACFFERKYSCRFPCGGVKSLVPDLGFDQGESKCCLTFGFKGLPVFVFVNVEPLAVPAESDPP